MAIALMERNVLEQIQAEYGGWIRQSKNAAVPYWNIVGTGAIDLLRKMRPHLVIERRKALANLLLKDPIVCDTQGRRGPGSNKIVHNEQVFQQMRKLNAVRLPAIPKVPTQQPSNADFSYLAGILDGEGHISFERRRIEVTSTDPELVAYLASRFGGNTYLQRKAKGNQRATWVWKRRPTGCTWAARVADEMLLTRKADELRKMQGFQRLAPLPTVPAEAGRRYVELVREGILPTVAAREAGLPMHYRKYIL